jgi:hypothetical protein
LEQRSDNPTLWLVFEPVCEPVCPPAEQAATPAEVLDSAEQLPLTEEVTAAQEAPASAWPDDTGIQIIRATRSWIQYGTVGFAVFCIIIGALEGLFGR